MPGCKGLWQWLSRLAAARKDPDAQALEDHNPESVGPVVHVARATRIRWQLQNVAERVRQDIHIPLGILRDWEQHRQEPDQPARAYLEVIAREPDAVRRALDAPVTDAA